jgi:hypothetical protein
MKMRVKKPIPWHRYLCVGDEVEALPSVYIPKCYNIKKIGDTSRTIHAVPVDFLEEIKKISSTETI